MLERPRADPASEVPFLSVSVRAGETQYLLGKGGGDHPVGVRVEVDVAHQVVALLVEEADDVQEWDPLATGPVLQVAHELGDVTADLGVQGLGGQLPQLLRARPVRGVCDHHVGGQPVGEV